MEIKKISRNDCCGIKFSVEVSGKEVGRAYLYIISNDLHNTPYGFLEDVFVDSDYREQGVGTQVVQSVIEEARRQKCYKLIGTSRYDRPNVHAWYVKMGFLDYGKEFRLNL